MTQGLALLCVGCASTLIAKRFNARIDSNPILPCVLKHCVVTSDRKILAQNVIFLLFTNSKQHNEKSCVNIVNRPLRQN